MLDHTSKPFSIYDKVGFPLRGLLIQSHVVPWPPANGDTIRRSSAYANKFHLRSPGLSVKGGDYIFPYATSWSYYKALSAGILSSSPVDYGAPTSMLNTVIDGAVLLQKVGVCTPVPANNFTSGRVFPLSTHATPSSEPRDGITGMQWSNTVYLVDPDHISIASVPVAQKNSDYAQDASIFHAAVSGKTYHVTYAAVHSTGPTANLYPFFGYGSVPDVQETFPSTALIRVRFTDITDISQWKRKIGESLTQVTVPVGTTATWSINPMTEQDCFLLGIHLCAAVPLPSLEGLFKQWGGYMRDPGLMLLDSTKTGNKVLLGLCDRNGADIVGAQEKWMDLAHKLNGEQLADSVTGSLLTSVVELQFQAPNPPTTTSPAVSAAVVKPMVDLVSFPEPTSKLIYSPVPVALDGAGGTITRMQLNPVSGFDRTQSKIHMAYYKPDGSVGYGGVILRTTTSVPSYVDNSITFAGGEGTLFGLHSAGAFHTEAVFTAYVGTREVSFQLTVDESYNHVNDINNLLGLPINIKENDGYQAVLTDFNTSEVIATTPREYRTLDIGVPVTPLNNLDNYYSPFYNSVGRPPQTYQTHQEAGSPAFGLFDIYPTITDSRYGSRFSLTQFNYRANCLGLSLSGIGLSMSNTKIPTTFGAQRTYSLRLEVRLLSAKVLAVILRETYMDSADPSVVISDPGSVFPLFNAVVTERYLAILTPDEVIRPGPEHTLVQDVNMVNTDTWRYPLNSLFSSSSYSSYDPMTGNVVWGCDTPVAFV